jgi:hypothetical protein
VLEEARGFFIVRVSYKEFIMKTLLTIPVLLLSVVSLSFSPSLFAEHQGPVTGAMNNSTKEAKDVIKDTQDKAHGAVKTTGDTVKTGGDAVKTTGDTVKTGGDAVKTTGDAVKTGGEETRNMVTDGTVE